MNCIICGRVIPENRLKAVPGTKTCVEHSTTGKKVGTPITLGSGDHTYTELNIMDPDAYERFERLRKRYED